MTLVPIAGNKKSTIGRAALALRATRAGFRALGPVAPSAAARIAEAIFFTPPRHRPPRREREFLATGRAFTLRMRGQRIAAWSWGRGPAVLLVHGWAGRAGQFSSLAPAFVDAGYSVVAFDAPGHGASDGRQSSLPAVAEATLAVADLLGPVRAVVAHSFGAAGATFALDRGLDADRAVFLAPPSDMIGYSRRLAAHLRLSSEVLHTLQQRVERRLGITWADVDMQALARSQRTPLLIVHDWADAEVPYAEGEALARAWPGATLVTTAGLSHRRVLHYPDVVDRVVRFVGDATPARPGARAASELADDALEQEGGSVEQYQL